MCAPHRKTRIAIELLACSMFGARALLLYLLNICIFEHHLIEQAINANRFASSLFSSYWFFRSQEWQIEQNVKSANKRQQQTNKLKKTLNMYTTTNTQYQSPFSIAIGGGPFCPCQQYFCVRAIVIYCISNFKCKCFVSFRFNLFPFCSFRYPSNKLNKCDLIGFDLAVVNG